MLRTGENSSLGKITPDIYLNPSVIPENICIVIIYLGIYTNIHTYVTTNNEGDIKRKSRTGIRKKGKAK